MARTRKTKDLANVEIGIGTFSESEFPILKLLAEDAEKLDDTFTDYRANVERVKTRLKAHNPAVVIEIPLTVAEVEAYCSATGQPNTGTARAELAQIRLEHRTKDSQT